MGRVRGEIVVGGQKRWTLFDSGARHSYIVADAVPQADIKSLLVERTMALGGKSHRVRQVCLAFAEVEGHLLDFEANVVEEMDRDVRDRRIEVLFGALAMQAWGLKLDPPSERVNWSHFSTDFVEF